MTRDEHERLLVALHQEMKAGRGDAAVANELSRKMNALWHELTDEERELFDELSEDLYIVENKRRVLPLDPGETAESVEKSAKRAFGDGHDREALGLARKLSDASSRLPYIMGRCWERLGFLRGATCFYDFAYDREPRAVFAVSAMETLARSDRLAEAFQRAEDIEKRPVVEGTLLLQAASIFHRAAKSRPADQRAELYQRVTRLVESSWLDNSALPSVRASGLLAAGFSYEHLQRHADAVRSFERAVAISPTDAPLLALGLAILESDRKKALASFTAAAKRHTTLDWPYLYAARNALEGNRLAEVEEFCAAGLSVSPRPELRGRFFEWTAIAAARLGRSNDEVRELFERAQAELPFDQTIQRNAASFAEFTGVRDWELEQPEAPPTLVMFEETFAAAA